MKATEAFRNQRKKERKTKESKDVPTAGATSRGGCRCAGEGKEPVRNRKHAGSRRAAGDQVRRTDGKETSSRAALLEVHNIIQSCSERPLND